MYLSCLSDVKKFFEMVKKKEEKEENKKKRKRRRTGKGVVNKYKHIYLEENQLRRVV